MTRLVAAGVAALALIASAPSAAAAQTGAGATAQAPPAPPPPAVKVGQPMPDFALPYLEPAPDGSRPTTKTAKLSDHKGKVVVLAFFPAAFSPG